VHDIIVQVIVNHKKRVTNNCRRIKAVDIALLKTWLGVLAKSIDAFDGLTVLILSM
jgi:hypothetical protein